MQASPAGDQRFQRGIVERGIGNRDGVELPRRSLVRLAGTRQFAFLQENVKGNIVVFGIEPQSGVLPEVVAAEQLLPGFIIGLAEHLMQPARQKHAIGMQWGGGTFSSCRSRRLRGPVRRVPCDGLRTCPGGRFLACLQTGLQT